MITYEEYAKLRDLKGLRDSDVSKKTGIPQATFSDWKRGKYVPKYEKMCKIAEAIGCYYGEFVNSATGDPVNDTFLEKPSEISEDQAKAMELYHLFQNLTPENRIAFETLLKNLQ